MSYDDALLRLSHKYVCQQLLLQKDFQKSMTRDKTLVNERKLSFTINYVPYYDSKPQQIIVYD